MLDKVKIKSAAKLNFFLHVLKKRKDGYHNIFSAITFINLYDEITISLSNKLTIDYLGPFKPKFKNNNEDIILKTLKILNLEKKMNLKVVIKKNIPYQAGLGSASADAAGLIRGLEHLSIINKKNNKFLSKIGADVPACYFSHDCLVSGLGDKISFDIKIPKYYFLLVKLDIDFSTKEMYQKINLFCRNNNFENDFQKIAIEENKKIKRLLEFMSNVDQCIFSRMTGTGSCCYSVFEKKKDALNAQKIINSKFINSWTFVGKNTLYGFNKKF